MAVKFVLNATAIPAAYCPARWRVEYPAGTATDLAGRPVGASDWPEAVLEWEHISAEALAWWAAWFAADRLSVQLGHVLLPDEERGTSITWGGTTYTYHTQWFSGLLLRPELEGSQPRRLSGARYRTGGCRIRIVNLGRPA